MINLKKRKSVFAVMLLSLLGMGFSNNHNIAYGEKIKNEYSNHYADKNKFFVNEEGVLTKYTGCSSEVKVPAGVKSIGLKVFSDHPEIERVDLPEGLISISNYAFADCSRLRHIELPESVESIGALAFGNCIFLENINIGKNVHKMGELVFWGCEELSCISVSKDNKFFSSDKGVLFNKEKTLLIKAPSGIHGNYSIPNGVEKINDYSFFGCKRLEGVSIPDTVRVIGDTAFYSCCELKNVSMGENVDTIGSCSFADCILLDNLILPQSLRTVGSNAFFNCLSMKEIRILSTDILLGHRVFGACKNLVICAHEESGLKGYAIGHNFIFSDL